MNQLKMEGQWVGRVHPAVQPEGPHPHAHGRDAVPVRAVRQGLRQQLQPAPAHDAPHGAQALPVHTVPQNFCY